MRLDALAAQRLALADAEAMLLIDDDEAHVCEGRLLADERMGSDRDERLAAGCGEGAALALGRWLLPRDEHRVEPGSELWPEGVDDRPEVLRGQHLGRREHDGLAACLGDLQHGAQGHHRLAAADLALHEPVHGVLPVEVCCDLVADLMLVGSEIEGQP